MGKSRPDFVHAKEVPTVVRLGQKRFITALTGTCAALTVAVVPVNSAFAKPSLDEVKHKVDRLYQQAEVASERYNDARILRDSLQQDLASVKSDEAAQKVVVDRIESAVDGAIAAQYEGQALSATGQMAVTDDPGRFLTQLNTLSAYNDVQSETLASYDRAQEALDIRHDAVAQRTTELASVAKRLAKEKADVEANLAEAKATLAKLEDDEMKKYLAAVSAGENVAIPKVSASGRAGLAVRYAMAQLGDPYVWGAAGPNSFDCSGLTMMAWAAAGVSLPHSSRAQSGMGTPVSINQLQPGDLVFYYSPVSHVAMYIGGGKIVHAPHSGANVEVADLNRMPITGARRMG
jgi:cell wall-associated NlpC family hydrolase